MTRLLVDPATDFDDPGPVTLTATLLDPGPTLVRTFEAVTTGTVVDLPAPAPAQAWRLTVRRPRTTTTRWGAPSVDPGPIVEERTVHFTDGDPVAWAALTDVDPATLRTTAVPGTAWDAAIAELRAEVDALPTGGGGGGGGFSGAYADLTGKPTIPATPADIGAEPAGTIDARISALVGAAPDALNTLAEIDAQLATDEGSAAALAALVGTKAAALTTAATRTTSATVAVDTVNPFDATARAVTVTLPTPSKAGQVITVEKIDVTGNPVTVSGTIRGTVSTVAIVWQYESVLLVAESLTSWRPVAGHKTKATLDAAYETKGAVAAQATTDAATYATTRDVRSNLFKGLPIIATRGQAYADNTAGSNQSNGIDLTATFRYKHVALYNATEVRLVYGNIYNGDVKGVSNLTIRAGVEYPVATPQGSATVASTFPVSFNGARSVTIEPGCWAVSDPVPVDVNAGQLLYTRTNVATASGGKWPLSLYTYSGDQEGVTTGTDLSDSGSITNATGRGYGPMAVLGVPDSGRRSTVAAVGDSITYGSGDSGFPNGLGFLSRACATAGIGLMNLARNTEQIAQVSAATGFKSRRALMAACTHLIETMGRNDWGNAATLATLQANKLLMWTSAARRGIKVTAATNLPATTSTDGWTTTGGQTVIAGETVRVAFNDWLRDGAPILSGVAVVTGSNAAGTLRTGQAGHPLIGYHELADVMESARNSGLWKVGTLRTVTDAAITSNASTLTSATAAFTAADIGKQVAVTGAGATGTVLNATVLGVTNSTTATLDTNASTTVTGATARVGPIYCTDGTHPSTYGHSVLAGGVSTSLFA